MKTPIGICLAGILAGCAGPLGISMQSPEQLHQAYFYDLCQSWRIVHSESALAELRRRGTFTPDEMRQIQSNTVSIGMSQSAAKCSWGTPRAEHSTTLASGTSTQWAYEGASYLYVRDEKVVAMQN
jgi:hypothetical protein